MTNSSSDFKRLSAEYKEIYDYTTQQYSTMPADLLDRITMLNTYLARSGKMKAETEYLLNLKLEEVLGTAPADTSATAMRMLKEAKSKNEQYLHSCIDRLNATIVHQLDAIRSQLSYLKTEMQNIR